MFSFIKSLWRHRHFVPAAIRGEFKSRVARSKIGAAWFVLQPLAMASIYIVVLSEVLGAKLGDVAKPGAYGVYLLAGITAWGLFSEILNRSLSVFIEYGNTMKKIAFPKIFLPMVVLGGSLITNLLLMLVVTAIFALYAFYPSAHWFGIFAAAGTSILLAFGFGILLGIINVFTRDVGQVMTVVMNIWFWLTPIVYAPSMVNDTIGTLLQYNPMTPVVMAYQDAIVRGIEPDLNSLQYPAILGLVMVCVSMFAFWRSNGEIVDAL